MSMTGPIYSIGMLIEQDKQDARAIACEALGIEPVSYVNHYECEECGVSWDDEWECMSDDECPECGRDFSPLASDPIWPDEVP